MVPGENALLSLHRQPAGKQKFSSTFYISSSIHPFFHSLPERFQLQLKKKKLLTFNCAGVLTVMLSPHADVILVVMDTGEHAA